MNGIPSRVINRGIRHRTGLRNRQRSGRSTYSKNGKQKKAERYDRPFLDHPNHGPGIQYGCCTKKGNENGK